MSKNLRTVFIIIGTLVLALIIWVAVFGGGGALKTGWNAVVSPVNTTWKNITGGSNNLLPTFEESQGGSYDGNTGLGDAQF